MSKAKQLIAQQQEMARGGSDHKEEVRARVIPIRQKTYDRLKNSKFAGFGMAFDGLVFMIPLAVIIIILAGLG